ncbi:CinA family protein [Thalassovita sp.]|jgi:nicotinamide-nucleotide amidase|uniref:CinA family protein n=1 Tax=Thalassovita sp. TaxID=1979401 RepID=UPI003B59A370
MSVAALLELYMAKGLRIATAESCTGGMVSAAITDVAGSSAVFERGFVTYTNEAKIQMLGVQKDTLDALGAVSEEVAAQMALGALANSEADVAVAITGIAGPGGSDFKPEGRVCFALATKTGPVHTETVEFGAIGRDNVRARSVQKSIDLLKSAAT